MGGGGTWTVYRFKGRRDLARKWEGGVFEGGLILQCSIYTVMAC